MKFKYQATITILIFGIATVGIFALPKMVEVTQRNQTAAVADFNSSLVAHYTFDDGSASDSSGNGSGGTVNGATLTTGRIGAGGLSFDGVDDHVLLSNVVIPTTDITFCVWFYPKSGAPSRSGSLINNTKFFVAVDTFNDPNFKIQFSNNEGVNTGNSNPFSSEDWHHICMVRSGSTGSVYLDGALSGTANQNIGTPASTAFHPALGQYSSIGGGSLYGILDDVRIYNRALDAGEVSQIYNGDLSNPVNDTMPPLFSNIRSSVSPTSATITWTTNEASDSQIEYGLTSSYGSLSSLDATSVTSHTQTISGLDPQKTYHFRVRSKDSAGNQGLSSAGQTFTTGAPAGTTIPAATCSYDDVKSAIAQAPDEGVVTVPAGNCTWTQQMLIDLTSPPRSLILKGAGIDGAENTKTIISDGVNTSWDWPGIMISVVTPATRSFRLTGFTFRTSPSLSVKKGSLINMNGDSKAFRIDHNEFGISASSGRSIYTTGFLYGVIDHNRFGPTVSSVVTVDHSSWGGKWGGNGSWAAPLSFGTEQAVFIEDNEIRSQGVTDAYNGARFVLRRNYIEPSATFVPIQNHGVEGNNRSPAIKRKAGNSISFT
jgi:hypothetical protein